MRWAVVNEQIDHGKYLNAIKNIARPCINDSKYGMRQWSNIE